MFDLLAGHLVLSSVDLHEGVDVKIGAGYCGMVKFFEADTLLGVTSEIPAVRDIKI